MRHRKKERRAQKARAAGKAATKGGRRASQGKGRARPLADLSITENVEEAKRLSELVQAHADLDLAEMQRGVEVADEDMKENQSPCTHYYTAGDEGDAASFALMSTDRSRGREKVDSSPLVTLREKLSTITTTPVLRRVYSPTRKGYGVRSRSGKKPPRIQITKREMSSSQEVKALIQMRRLLDGYVSVDRVQDLVADHEEEGVEQEYPRLLIDGMEIGNLEEVMELEAAGFLGQMLASSSFTKGFLEAGPCPPGASEVQIQFAEASKYAHSAVEELRRSLDTVEKKILQQSEVSEVLSFGKRRSSILSGAVKKPAKMRLHHSWDATGKSIGLSGSKRASEEVKRSWGDWEWPSTQALLREDVVGSDDLDAAMKSPSGVKDSIKYLSSEAKGGDDPHTELDEYLESLLKEERGIGTSEPCGRDRVLRKEAGSAPKEVEVEASDDAEPRSSFRWKHFLLGVVAVPAVVMIATQGVAPLVCTAARAVRQSRAKRKKFQNLIESNLLGIETPVSFASVSRRGEKYASGGGQSDGSGSSASPARKLFDLGAGIQQRLWRYAGKIVEMLGGVPKLSWRDSARRYICLEAGDSLWGISDELYGDGSHWKRIADHNKLKFPFKLLPGHCLELPPSLESHLQGMG
ncbi:hypothetical protein HOP50_03g24700 [Chloropicon primus]|uniref:LysM domain-containing protein n=1 Tax=Chloropicon primus TaxID=1764295 RepID=A0A5B8MKQ5_9CHLO|nr:hypothetical protein A3770_03p24700 [Chloropicon primus]UPQ99163.1 hypothetical protein HOP50_03g24700 [Chloropicon primus]|eukprot:QDZ19952.1 hypothetical protein A3770_03p24700 [Chloropicon primus]